MAEKRPRSTRSLRSRTLACSRRSPHAAVIFRGFIKSLVSGFAAQTSARAQHPAAAAVGAPRFWIPGDYKFPVMPDSCSVEQFKTGSHDGLAFLEANARWSQASRVLHELQKSLAEIDDIAFKRAVSDVDRLVVCRAWVW